MRHSGILSPHISQWHQDILYGNTSIYHNILWSILYKCYQKVSVASPNNWLSVHWFRVLKMWRRSCTLIWSTMLRWIKIQHYPVTETSRWQAGLRDNQMLFVIIRYILMLRFNVWIIKHTLQCYSLKISAYNKVSLVWLSYSQKQTWN